MGKFQKIDAPRGVHKPTVVKEPHLGVPLVVCSHSLNLLISNFDPPTTQTFRCLIVWVRLGGGVVWCGVGRSFRNIFASKSRVFFFFLKKIF